MGSFANHFPCPGQPPTDSYRCSYKQRTSSNFTSLFLLFLWVLFSWNRLFVIIEFPLFVNFCYRSLYYFFWLVDLRTETPIFVCFIFLLQITFFIQTWKQFIRMVIDFQYPVSLWVSTEINDHLKLRVSCWVLNLAIGIYSVFEIIEF